MSFELNNQDDNADYMGNIWGWKFSFISLGVIAVLLAWVIYKTNFNPSDFSEEDRIENFISE